MLYFIGQILPYIAVFVFVGGMIVQVISWLKKPVPFPQTLFPASSTAAGRVMDFIAEIVIFKSMRRGSKGLWLWAWLLHVALAMIILGHIVGIGTLAQQFVVIGVSAAVSVKLSAALGNLSGLILFAALIVLLYRRTADTEAKRLSDPADYFCLLLLLAIVISGMHMRLTTHEVDLMAIRTYLAGILTLSPVAIPQDWIFISHYSLVMILLIYAPFSKLVHLAGYFVNRALLAQAPPVYPTPATGAKQTLPGFKQQASSGKGGLAE